MTRLRACAVAAAIFISTAGLMAQQQPPASAEATAGRPAAITCTISGSITGLGGPLPGVSITARRDGTVHKAASTDVDGTFKLTLPGASYHLTAELTGFDTTEKDVALNG